MRTIYLVKHASPIVQPGVASDRWPLGEKGREAATSFSQRLAGCGATAVITSTEPKAIQTGEIIAQHLGVKSSQAEGLHEHERKTVPHLRTPEFLGLMAQVFRRPSDLVLGEESAQQTLTRFRSAIDQVLADNPTGDLIIVSHGTAIALLAESLGSGDGYQLWRAMPLPSYILLSAPPLTIKNAIPQS